MPTLFSDVFNPENHDSQDYLELLKAFQRAVDVNVISSVTSRNGTILYANEKFCEVCKIPHHELVGKNHRIINSGYHPKAFFDQMWKTISAGGVWHGEVRNKASDGSFYWVDTVILPIYNKRGEIFRYLSLRYLISEKKKAEAEREEYILALEDLMKITSHKIRKPVANCLGIFELADLRKKAQNNPDSLTREELEMLMLHVRDSAKELEKFTHELTEYLHRLKQRYYKNTPRT